MQVVESSQIIEEPQDISISPHQQYSRPPRPPTARTERELLQIMSGDRSHSRVEDPLKPD